MVHFFDNSFVKIDSFKASTALFLINISRSGRLPMDSIVKRTIAEVIVDWNKNGVYNAITNTCQDFVEDMIEQIMENCKSVLTPDDYLSFSFKHNKLVKRYLEELVKHPEQAGMYFDFNGTMLNFRSHDGTKKKKN